MDNKIIVITSGPYYELNIIGWCNTLEEYKIFKENNDKQISLRKEYDKAYEIFNSKYPKFVDVDPPIEPRGPQKVDVKSLEWANYIIAKEKYNEEYKVWLDNNWSAWKAYKDQRDKDCLAFCGVKPTYFDELGCEEIDKIER